MGNFIMGNSARIVAIVGSYRRGGVTDAAVGALLSGAEGAGASIHRTNLVDEEIGYCTNCRTCCQPPGPDPGPCVQHDDMDKLLSRCLAADLLVLASPVNIGQVTAVTKTFYERMTPLAHWPWGQAAPKLRVPDGQRKAVLITSCAAPGLVVRLPLVDRLTGMTAMRTLGEMARLLGARVVHRLVYGLSALRAEGGLDPAQLHEAEVLGRRLAEQDPGVARPLARLDAAARQTGREVGRILGAIRQRQS
jgi:hypothetical protein